MSVIEASRRRGSSGNGFSNAQGDECWRTPAMASELDRGDGCGHLTSPQGSMDLVGKVDWAGVLPPLTLTREASLYLGNTRPFVGRCCYICTPQSWGLLFHNYLTLLGFRNTILVTETHTRYRGWLARRLSYFLFICGRTVYPCDIRDLEEKIINSARVQEAIHGSLSNGSSSDHKSVQEVKRKVRGIVGQIRAVVSPLLLRLTGWVLLKVFNWVFVNLQVHRGQLEMLRKARAQYGCPFIFVPVHKSRLDHLLVTFILFCHSVRVPYLTGGEDIGLPLLRSLLRRLGGIFIPSQVGKGAESGHTNHLNQAVLTSYVEELLRRQENLQLYLEEAVPSSVRPSLTGMVRLSCVFKAFQSGVIPDAALVPVGISYDRIIEGGCLEQMDPNNVSLWTALCWTLRFVWRRYGCVRVDFGQPFSLKDYIENEAIRMRSSVLPLRELLLPYVFGSSSDAVYYERSRDWILSAGEGLPRLDRHERQLVTGLGRHLLYTATSCSGIMSTTIMASLLLHKHRQGALLSVLAKDFQWLMEEVLARQFDVGFSGKLRDVVLHSLYLLRDCVTLGSFPLNDLLVTPRPTRRAMRELSVCSRGILPVFIYETVAACALNALLRQVANCVTDWESNIEVAISQEEITCKSIQLCHLLPSEILLLPPCRSTYQFAQEAVDKLTYCEILVVEENENKRPACDMWNRRFSKELSWKVTEDSDSDSDCGAEFSHRYFRLGQSSDSHECFLFLCALLEPVIKAYGRAVGFLERLDSPKPESECVRKLLQYLETQAEEQGSYESATFDLANSAVQTFKELGVLQEEPGVTGIVLAFSDVFLQSENRQTLQDYIQQFSC